MTDLGLMTYFSWNGNQAGRKRSIRLLKEVCKGNIEEISNGRMQGYEYTMNQKEKLSKDDGFDNVDEGHYRSLIGCLMYLT